MQLCDLTLRHGGSLLSSVPKTNVTPAEILILQALHGSDACVDIRPTKFDKKKVQSQEWERLSYDYDRASGMVSTPGEESTSVMRRLFPGAMHKLPTTLKEIGLGHLLSAASIKAAEAGLGAAAVPVDEVDLSIPEEDEVDEDEDAYVTAEDEDA